MKLLELAIAAAKCYFFKSLRKQFPVFMPKLVLKLSYFCRHLYFCLELARQAATVFVFREKHMHDQTGQSGYRFVRGREVRQRS